MTQTFWITACVAAVSAMSLSACATPNYPITPGQTSTAAPPTPHAATSAAPASGPTPVQVVEAPPQAAAPEPAPPPVQTPPPPAAVESQPLPPVAGASASPSPAAAAPSEPPQSGVQPGYTPPSASPPAPPPSEPAYAPPPSYSAPPAYSAPEVAYRPAPPRYAAGGKVVEARGMFRDYEVRKGDHVDAIARDLQTTRKVLVDANHLEKPYNLQPGQHLKVPVAKAYEVQSGDTIAAVAKRFGVSAGELADLNDLPVRGRLRAGDRLALPDHFDDRGPTRLPSTMVAQSTRRSAAPPPSYAPPSYATQSAAPQTSPSPYRAANPSLAHAPPPAYSAPTEGGAYVPSPAALAAAQRLAAEKAYAAHTPQTGTYSRPYTPPRATYSTSSAPPTPTPAGVIQAGQGRFIWPVRGDIISGYGVTGVGRRNDGVDIKAPQGTVVRAAAAGNVVYAGDQVPGFGNLVLIKHSDGWVTAYAHLDSVTVQMRQSVTQSQAIGEVGQTGGVAGPQLHFEVRYAASPADKAKPVDPLAVLPK